MSPLSELLTLPGSGVFTVHTGQEKKNFLLKEYYGTTDETEAKKIWAKKSLKLKNDLPHLFGIPSDNGGGIQRGANWGPLILREELLKRDVKFRDLGDVRVIPHLLHDKYLNQETINDCQKALYGKKNKLPVSPLSMAEEALKLIYHKSPEIKIFGMGGDHSTSYPLVKTWFESRSQPKKSALIHFDAHTDLLDKRLGIDLCFGTWTYHIIKDLGLKNQVYQLGIRSTGKTKAHWEKTCGVKQIWAKQMNQLGPQRVTETLVSQLKKNKVQEIYISFDIDALDIAYASATGTPEAQGINPFDAAYIIQALSEEFFVTGADLMELAPFVLPNGVRESSQKSSIDVAADISSCLIRALS